MQRINEPFKVRITSKRTTAHTQTQLRQRGYNNNNNNNNVTLSNLRKEALPSPAAALPVIIEERREREEGGISRSHNNNNNNNNNSVIHIAGSGSRVPLRSKTIIAPRLRLQTYDDATDMRAALRRLQEACGHSDEILLSNSNSSPTIPLASCGGSLHRLPAHLLQYCFTFCDVRTLAMLAAVNHSFSVLSNVNFLWEAHARRLNINRIESSGLTNAKEELRRAILENEEREEAEVRRHEEEYEEIAQRLQARTEAERAIQLNVNTALLNTRYQVGGDDIFTNNNNNNNSGNGSLGAARTAAEERALRAQLTQLESEKLNLLNELREIKTTLAKQQEQMQQLQTSLVGSQEISIRTRTRRIEEEEENNNEFITYSELQSFERRMCRIILNTITDLSIILRRGVTDFSTMELLCLHGGGDVGGKVRQRWAAFKRFFPILSNDYGTIRVILLTGEAISLLNDRTRETLGRLGGIIRRIQKMTDAEVLQIIM